jgi:glutamine amidotransferase
LRWRVGAFLDRPFVVGPFSAWNQHRFGAERPEMKLFACMCNQPKRLAAALAPVRALLVAEAPVSRWGFGYSQSGDVLLVRTPKASDKPIDLAAPLAEIPTDCAIAQAVRDDRERTLYSGTDNTPPFRFRRWMFAQTGAPELEAFVPRLVEHIPEYLRRNIKGRSPAELVFHVFLAMLHDEGSVDDSNVPVQVTRRALAATIKLVRAEQEKAGLTAMALGNIATSNGRSMVVARIDEPLRLRRLWVSGERGERDESFRGVLLVSGGDGDPRDGFEDVPAHRTVLVTRDLHVQLADLAP